MSINCYAPYQPTPWQPTLRFSKSRAPAPPTAHPAVEANWAKSYQEHQDYHHDGQQDPISSMYGRFTYIYHKKMRAMSITAMFFSSGSWQWLVRDWHWTSGIGTLRQEKNIEKQLQLSLRTTPNEPHIYVEPTPPNPM